MKRKAMRSGYALLRKKGANCPECGKALHLPREMPEGDDVLQCTSCSWSGGMMDLIPSGNDWGELSSQPAGSKIVKSEIAEGVRWLMPASKRPNFLCFFALIWLGFISFMSFGALFGEVEGDEPTWILFLFFIPFWLVGIGVAYAGLRMMLMESILLVNAEEVQLMQKLFGKVKLKKLKRADVKRVERYTAYKQNERPVYGIRVVTDGKEKLAFGSRLKEDDKRWLLSELREVLMPKMETSRPVVSSAAGYGGAMQIASYDSLDEIVEKGLKLKRVGHDSFRLEREHKSGGWFLLGGLVGCVVSGFLFFSSYQSLDFIDEGFDFFDLLGALLSAVPFIMALVFGAMGIGAFFAAKHFMGLVERFEFSPDELLVKKGKRGHRGKETRYSKDTFHSVSSRNAGHVNNDPRYSVSLKGRNKRVSLVGFVKQDTADHLVSWLDVWLGH
jgi:hypothetical protein